MNTITLREILVAGHWLGFNAIDLCCLIVNSKHDWTDADNNFYSGCGEIKLIDNKITFKCSIYQHEEGQADIDKGNFYIVTQGITDASEFQAIIEEYNEHRLTGPEACAKLLNGIVTE